MDLIQNHKSTNENKENIKIDDENKNDIEKDKNNENNKENKNEIIQDVKEIGTENLKVFLKSLFQLLH